VLSALITDRCGETPQKFNKQDIIPRSGPAVKYRRAKDTHRSGSGEDS